MDRIARELELNIFNYNHLVPVKARIFNFFKKTDSESAAIPPKEFIFGAPGANSG